MVTIAYGTSGAVRTGCHAFIWGRDFSDVQGNAGGAGSLLAQISGTSVSYAIPDALGNIVAYADSSGSIAAAVEYSPFGKGVNASGSWQSYPIGFSGQYMDWEPGIVYYGLRYYAPKHGRFINRDPIEEAGGNNLYAFVHNAPTRGWDVLGLDDGDEPIVLPPYEVRSSRSSWPSSVEFYEYSRDYWGTNYVTHTIMVTGGTFGDPPVIQPLTRGKQKAPNKEQLSKSDCDGIVRQMVNLTNGFSRYAQGPDVSARPNYAQINRDSLKKEINGVISTISMIGSAYVPGGVVAFLLDGVGATADYHDGVKGGQGPAGVAFAGLTAGTSMSQFFSTAWEVAGREALVTGGRAVFSKTLGVAGAAVTAYNVFTPALEANAAYQMQFHTPNQIRWEWENSVQPQIKGLVNAYNAGGCAKHYGGK